MPPHRPGRHAVAFLLLLVDFPLAMPTWAGEQRHLTFQAEPATEGADRADPPPLELLIGPADQFLQDHEQYGVTPDPRVVVDRAEAIRLSVVSQTLAYYELYLATGYERYRKDVISRADFLVELFDSIITGSAFDGHLGYALACAYEITGNATYMARAETIARQCIELSGRDNSLNWGLMCAMNLAKHHQLTGDAQSLQKIDEILAVTEASQNPDGSFPHICADSEDVHYSAWMAMELVLIDRAIDHPRLTPMLDGIHGFVAQRIATNGDTVYEDRCGPVQFCYYWSQASGCAHDYDTRGWTNELAYSALLFDHYDDEQFDNVVSFLTALATDGAFPDKWDYPLDPEDERYPWATEERSVIRTSVILWALAAILNRDAAHRAPLRAAAHPGANVPSTPRAVPVLARVLPNPTTGPTSIEFTLDSPGHVSLRVLDVRGRPVRDLLSAVLTAGSHTHGWDGDTATGSRAARGVYFLEIRTRRSTMATKIHVIR